MTTRKVVVFNMGDNSRQQVMTDAETWGQLLEASPSVRNMVSSDMEIVIKQTRTTIKSEQSVLPEGEVMIYLTPGKVKSGAKTKKQTSKTLLRPFVEPVIRETMEAVHKDMEHLLATVESRQKGVK